MKYILFFRVTPFPFQEGFFLTSKITGETVDSPDNLLYHVPVYTSYISNSTGFNNDFIKSHFFTLAFSKGIAFFSFIVEHGL